MKRKSKTATLRKKVEKYLCFKHFHKRIVAIEKCLKASQKGEKILIRQESSPSGGGFARRTIAGAVGNK